MKKREPVTFVIHGVAAPRPRINPTVEAVKKFLDASKLGELWSSSDLMLAVDRAPSSLGSCRVSSSLPGYFVDDTVACGPVAIHRRARLWGKPATIEAYHEQTR